MTYHLMCNPFYKRNFNNAAAVLIVEKKKQGTLHELKLSIVLLLTGCDLPNVSLNLKVKKTSNFIVLSVAYIYVKPNNYFQCYQQTVSLLTKYSRNYRSLELQRTLNRDKVIKLACICSILNVLSDKSYM